MFEYSIEQKIVIFIVKKFCCEGYIKIDPSLTQNIDWDKLYKLILEQRIFLLIYKYIKDYIPKSYSEVYQQRYILFESGIKNAIHEIGKVSKSAKEKNIKVIFNKGLIYSKLIYNDLFLRDLGDIDTIISEKDILKMDSLLRKSGYYQRYGLDLNGNIKKLPIPILKNFNHYEYYDYIKKYDDKIVCLEVARRLHTISQDHMEKFITQTMEIEIKNYLVEVFDISHGFLALCENAYSNSESLLECVHSISLKDYIDISLFIRKYQDQFNWLEIKKLADEYRITHQLFRVFNNLNEIFPDYLKENIIMLFSPKNIPYKFEGNIDGSQLKWNMGFVQRLFDKERRFIEYKQLVKNKVYDDRSIDLFIIPSYQYFDIKNYRNYYGLNNWKYPNEVKIIPRFGRDRLLIGVCLDINFYGDLDNYLLEFRLYDHDIKNEKLATYVYLTRRNQKVSYNYFILKSHLFTSLELRNSTYFREDDKEIINIFNVEDKVFLELEIPFEFIPINTYKLLKKVYCHIYLFEKIYYDMYHTIGELKCFFGNNA